MATEKQLAANRANSIRSTGPKSIRGKTRSSMIIADEDPAEFDQLRQGLEEEFEPRSLLQGELVERLAGIMWRLRRIPRFEAALIEARRYEVARETAFKKAMIDRMGFEKEPKGPHGPDASAGFALIEDGQQQDALGKLSRHEAALMNQLTKTYHAAFYTRSRDGRGWPSYRRGRRDVQGRRGSPHQLSLADTQ
jgi:hypothetical protein